ncbi:hypothetical protein, partial [Gracilibacillus suaedae]|uniref:hypothetical protein n=1 Tax=Gracilibacillus suaedae TaxID=2820273 RepID=UPI001ABEA5FD
EDPLCKAIFFAKLAEDTPPGKRSGQAEAVVTAINHVKITTLNRIGWVFPVFLIGKKAKK